MIRLYAHQETALSLLRLNDGFCLFMEQGTGKTFPVLFRLAELARDGRISSALVVAPKAVRGSWLDKVAQLEPWQREALSCLEVASYDLVWRRPEYRDGTFDAVVLDESHFVKTPGAKRTKACMALCSRARYRWALTGTPTGNGQLCSIWSQLACVDPVVVPGRNGQRYVYPGCLGGDSYYKWLARVAVLDQWHKPRFYRDVASIQAVMAEWSYRITKAECLDLPEKMPDVMLRVALSQRARGEYRQMARHSAIEARETVAGNPLTRALRLRQIASGFLDPDEGGRVRYPNPKLSALEELMSGIEGKLVVFCDFRESIDQVLGLMAKLGVAAVALDGRSRGDEWRRFQADGGVRAIVCQYQSGSAGIDLHAADTMVFYEPTLSSNLLEQARDRIHRQGQRRPCSYYHIIAENTIEGAIYEALSNYADFGEALFERYLETYTKGARIS